MATTRRTSRTAAPAEIEQLTDYCSRPACRRTFTRALAAGRPQLFCSDICRRAAEKELRQARARLAHYESLSEQLRTDVAAFSRVPDTDTASGDSPQHRSQRGVEDAITRAAGILAFVGDSDEPLVREFRTFFDAVTPAARSTAAAAAG